MDTVDILVLQSPKIVIGHMSPLLPYQKAEALLYYLAIEKEVTREQAAFLLWDSCDEATAKKNLRHAIYTIKKVLGFEFIIAANRHTLALNPAFSFHIDYDDFMVKGCLEAYHGELLSGFYIKNAPSFEEWMNAKRSLVLDAYLKLLNRQFEELDTEDVTGAERIFDRYIKEDPLDESIYRLMMELYEKNGLYYKGVRLYQRLSILLEKELAAAPGSQTKALYSRLLQTWNRNNELPPEESVPKIQGRDRELSILSGAFRDFLNGAPTAYLLCGESGIGKTFLAEYFLRAVTDESCLTLKTSCLETEQSILMQPWNSVMLQLEQLVHTRNLHVETKYMDAVSCLFPLFGSVDLSRLYLANNSISFSYRTARNLLLKLFSSLSEQTAVILFFDNLNYMDSISLDFVSLLIRSQIPNIMLLGTCPPTFLDRQKTALTPLLKDSALKRLDLSPYSPEDVSSVNRMGSGGKSFKQMTLEKIERSPENAKKVLSLLSTCQSHADLKLFEDLLDLDALELLDILEELKEQDIICEKTEGKNVYFSFRNNSVRKLIYNRMSLSRRKVLHERLAENLAGLNNFGRLDYECLIYHYTQSQNAPLALKYRILTIEENVKRYYELYPMQFTVHGKLGEDIPSFPRYCDQLEDELLSFSEEEAAKVDVPDLYLSLLCAKAQFCIAQGDYEQGLDSQKKAMLVNEQTKNDPLCLIRCLRLQNFYSLNIWKLDDLDAAFSKCLMLERTHHFEEEYAIDCRLYGLFFSMLGDYENSMRYLDEAVRCFLKFPLKSRIYTLNIAACYNYMGENLRKQKDFTGAVALYQKAIRLCDTNHCPVNAVFYSNLGRAYLALGKKQDSSTAFYTSEQIYNESAALIGRSITKGYVSLLEAERGNFTFSHSLLQEAAESAAQLASPHSLGLLSLTRYILLRRFPSKFSFVLTEPLEYYRKTAISQLKDIPGMYELEGLDGL